jgi:hypothetical protein
VGRKCGTSAKPPDIFEMRETSARREKKREKEKAKNKINDSENDPHLDNRAGRAAAGVHP